MVLKAECIGAERNEIPVLTGVSFTLAAGQAVVVRGANGAGKTTLLRILAGLRRPDSGRLIWPDGMEPGRGQVAYLGHQDALKPTLSVLENIGFTRARPTGQAGGLSPLQALACFHLDHVRDVPARMLSAGQRRRVALARVVFSAAPIWILDEPATGLDEASVKALGQVLACHRAQGGRVVASTHTLLPLPDALELVL